ncbi:Restriction endonuclease [Cedratvirus A11]|uniref:Restriction endonuclease n=1 Tax=Cedratvirus A11 TaxID=1903266 RepID=A0A1M7XUG5_9VIRU|nr:homing endonuclease [Cedratvirus A11]SHO33325.1 Restriction endonuclease [Cedratvirus A11]
MYIITEKSFSEAVKGRGGKVIGNFDDAEKLVLCTCSQGHMFLLRPSRFFKRGNWCNHCNLSKGEKEIARVLDELDISYLREYKMKQLRHHSFDFFLVQDDTKYLIEYDGIQHFKVTEYNDKRELQRRKYVDKLKEEMCRKHGYVLIRIDYTQFNKIRKHILQGLQFSKGVYYSSSIY